MAASETPEHQRRLEILVPKSRSAMLTYGVAAIERRGPYSDRSSGMKPGSMKKRRRFKQTTSLKERLASFAEQTRAKASALRPGAEKEALLRKARQADTASHLDDWTNSPGLRPLE
jgi:hypothetical protein